MIFLLYFFFYYYSLCNFLFLKKKSFNISFYSFFFLFFLSSSILSCFITFCLILLCFTLFYFNFSFYFIFFIRPAGEVCWGGGDTMGKAFIFYQLNVIFFWVVWSLIHMGNLCNQLCSSVCPSTRLGW